MELLREGPGYDARLLWRQVSNVLRAGDLTLDCAAPGDKRGEEIALSAKEYALLEYMMYQQGRRL